MFPLLIEGVFCYLNLIDVLKIVFDVIRRLFKTFKIPYSYLTKRFQLGFLNELYRGLNAMC